MFDARRLVLGGFAMLSFVGCFPDPPRGYIPAARLDESEQGPKNCAARCRELGMRIGALVLVGRDLPACVCIPRSKAPRPAEPTPDPAPPSATPPTVTPAPGATPPAAPVPSAVNEGAAASSGYVVIAAAAQAAQRHRNAQMLIQQQQRLQQQQQQVLQRFSK